jgi:hypothetical protein
MTNFDYSYINYAKNAIDALHNAVKLADEFGEKHPQWPTEPIRKLDTEDINKLLALQVECVLLCALESWLISDTSLQDNFMLYLIDNGIQEDPNNHHD